MKYPYHVEHNGILYKPFEEIPLAGEVIKSDVKEFEAEAVSENEVPAEELESPKRRGKPKVE